MSAVPGQWEGGHFWVFFTLYPFIIQTATYLVKSVLILLSSGHTAARLLCISQLPLQLVWHELNFLEWNVCRNDVCHFHASPRSLYTYSSKLFHYLWSWKDDGDNQSDLGKHSWKQQNCHQPGSGCVEQGGIPPTFSSKYPLETVRKDTSVVWTSLLWVCWSSLACLINIIPINVMWILNYRCNAFVV